LTICAIAPLSLVLTGIATAAVFTPVPTPLVLAKADPTAVFAIAPPLLLLADAAAAAVFAPAPHPLVLAEATTTAIFALAPPPLKLAEAAATAVFTRAQSECKDCGKKGMLEGYGGPQRKRRKHEERGVNQTNASDLTTAPAPHPSAAKKPHKAPALCEHQRWT